jgi:hypothetical protein
VEKTKVGCLFRNDSTRVFVLGMPVICHDLHIMEGVCDLVVLFIVSMLIYIVISTDTWDKRVLGDRFTSSTGKTPTGYLISGAALAVATTATFAGIDML